MADSFSNDNTTCVVCFKNALYFSIGECDHPVCFECSTRMRVLCLQNECPICRRDISRVVFTDSIKLYKELRTKAFTEKFLERQFKIGFCNEQIKDAYENLLENRCKLCTKLPPFRNFNMLSDHMKKVHERFFCDLCVKHLKIFTCERKCYTRQELAHHRRKGDKDDTSHRGHPLCEFCEERFMDPDELYRHLRKEHLYCHLCDADGKNLYYASHSDLASHFKSDHFLCEEGECAGQHLTSVFRSEIDLKAHKATVHGRGMARGASRMARTLELQFNITPHQVAQRTPRDIPQSPPSPPPVPAAPQIDTRSDEQFPRLSAAAAPQNILLAPGHKTYKGDTLTRNDRNFPALDGNGSRASAPPPRTPATVAATIVRNTKPGVSIQVHSQPASASNFRLTQAGGNRISVPQQSQQPRKGPLFEEDFPSLSARDDHPSIGCGTSQPSKVSLINSNEMQALKSNQSNAKHKKPQLNTEAFPALTSTATLASPPQWITVSKSKEKNKPSKPEPPPPQPNERSFNAVADFPTLPVSKSKSKRNLQQSQSAQQTEKNKKDKKKQNVTKKENFIETNHVNGVTESKSKNNIANDNVSVKVDSKIKTVETNVCGDNNRNGGNGDFKLAAKDYPPLSKNDSGPSTVNSDFKQKTNGSVPPGFKPRPACNGMTFTNSSGQTFPAPIHSYVEPPDFDRRNQALVEAFTECLGSRDAMESFKVASRAFLDNIISADEFYHHCKSAMGSKFDDIFLEMVALLPDIAKQQELIVGRSEGKDFYVCPTCGQLLAPVDRRTHEISHWPALGSR